MSQWLAEASRGTSQCSIPPKIRTLDRLYARSHSAVIQRRTRLQSDRSEGILLSETSLTSLGAGRTAKEIEPTTTSSRIFLRFLRCQAIEKCNAIAIVLCGVHSFTGVRHSNALKANHWQFAYQTSWSHLNKIFHGERVKPLISRCCGALGPLVLLIRTLLSILSDLLGIKLQSLLPDKCLSVNRYDRTDRQIDHKV